MSFDDFFAPNFMGPFLAALLASISFCLCRRFSSLCLFFSSASVSKLLAGVSLPQSAQLLSSWKNRMKNFIVTFKQIGTSGWRCPILKNFKRKRWSQNAYVGGSLFEKVRTNSWKKGLQIFENLIKNIPPLKCILDIPTWCQKGIVSKLHHLKFGIFQSEHPLQCEKSWKFM